MRRGISAVLIILILPLIVYTNQTPVYITYDGSLYADWFIEHIEIRYIVLWSGAKYRITNNSPNSVGCDLGQFLKDINATIPDIMIWIHSHFHSPYPSEQDLKTFYWLKSQGFQGFYLIYLKGANTVTWVKGRGDYVRRK